MVSVFAHGQTQNSLVLGNYGRVCFQDSSIIYLKDSLPESFDNTCCLLVFSGAISQLNDHDIDRITDFVQNGGGLYLGADNWPLQSEANQMTQTIYSTESYGEFEEKNAEVNSEGGNFSLAEIDSIPAGETTVAFPLDPRLTVEAWINDAPLILSGSLGKGRIVIDGGYSRFYCTYRSDQSDELLKKIIGYLRNNQ